MTLRSALTALLLALLPGLPAATAAPGEWSHWSPDPNWSGLEVRIRCRAPADAERWVWDVAFRNTARRAVRFAYVALERDSPPPRQGFARLTLQPGETHRDPGHTLAEPCSARIWVHAREFAWVEP